jgi:heme A synthase
MAISEELLGFVRDALARGLSRAQILDALQKAHWTTEQTRGALAAFAEVDFPIPVPRARPYLSAREAFLYLVLFGTLYVSAYYLGSLVFDFINRAFPDPAAQTFEGSEEYVRQSMRWSVSAVIVSFPVFLYACWLTGRAIRLDPTKRASKIRRWLTYWTLFVAAAALLGDVTTLVYNLLGGELTVRFVLKIVTVGLIAGTAFTYYLRDLRIDEEESKA